MVGLKRVSGLRRSYRLSRGGAVHPDDEAPSSPGESNSSGDVPVSPNSGDIIRNTEGVGVGWLLEGGRRTPSSGPLLFSSHYASTSLPCSPCTHAAYPHYWTIGRVKFGVPLDQVCKNEDIPGPLLVLILKLNKEGPAKKDVFRAPGHQGSMKKLIHFLHNGRLVNIDNFSVYTIASVLKKFLRKLPEGVFGREGEEQLFGLLSLGDTEQKRELVQRLVAARPRVAQHLLVLLFGTFRVIANNAERGQTGMTSEALGVSVAPSFFRSCVTHGKTASMDDVLRFKVATQIMQFMIDNFGVSNLFGRENYEYYARITGRILRVEEDWIFAYRYPPDSLVAPMSGQEESQSTPALIHIPECGGVDGGPSGGGAGMMELDGGGLGSGSNLRMVVPENGLRESCTRLSISLEENGLYKGGGGGSVGGGSSSRGATACGGGGGGSGGGNGGSGGRNSALDNLTLDELRQVNHFAENTKSLSFLPQVHERQTERMRTRSEWFLTPQEMQCGRGIGTGSPVSTGPPTAGPPHAMLHARHRDALTAARKHGSDECKLLRRSSSKDKERRLVRRSSSKKDKENGQKKRDALRVRSSSAEVKGHPLQQHSSSPSMLHNIPPSVLQQQPLQQQNVMYPATPLQQTQQNVRPLQQQRSHDRLLGSPSRRGLLGSAEAGGPTPCLDEAPPPPLRSGGPLTELDCTETDVRRVHVSNTYKPRI